MKKYLIKIHLEREIETDEEPIAHFLDELAEQNEKLENYLVVEELKQ